MAERTTVARPYARAAFRFARDASALEAWSKLLAAAGAAISVPAVQPLLNHPRVARGRLAGLVCEVAGGNDLQGAGNFFHLLADNHRLGLLPEIAQLFERLRREHEARAQVHVRCAHDLSRAQLDLIAQAMKRRLAREVEVTAEIDEALIGGAVITVDDQVIDGSVIGRLEALHASLQH